MLYKNITSLFIIVCSGGFLLSGCGFTPLMQSSLAGNEKQKFDLHVQGTGYTAYKFRRELEKNLAPLPQMTRKPVRIDISVTEGIGSTLIAIDSTTTRMQTTLSATYTLRIGNESVGSESTNSVTSYPITAVDEFITKTSQAAATNRTAKDLSQDLAREIMIHLNKISPE